MRKDYKAEPTTAVIYDITANKSLYDGIFYYAMLENNLIKQTTNSLIEGQKASLTKEQFETLNYGDLIDGFNIEETFYVEEDIKVEFHWFWITLALVSIYPVCYILYILTRFKKVNEVIDRFFEYFDRPLTYIIYIIIFGGISIGLLFSFYSLGGSIKNTYDRIASTDLIETIAEVNHHDPGSGPRDRRFYLALSFDNQFGQTIHVTKEVTSNTYHNTQRDVSIMYKSDNPYEVFMQELSFKDLFDIFTSNTMINYYLTIILTAILLFTVYLLDKNRRTGSYW